jgi:hypothetical protein
MLETDSKQRINHECIVLGQNCATEGVFNCDPTHRKRLLNVLLRDTQYRAAFGLAQSELKRAFGCSRLVPSHCSGGQGQIAKLLRGLYRLPLAIAFSVWNPILR